MEIQMSDFALSPAEDRHPWEDRRRYYAEIIDGTVKASINFRWYGDTPPGYVIEHHVGRINDGYGRMGAKQREQANVLGARLEEQVRGALLLAGWRVIGSTRLNIDVWHYYGSEICELEERLRALAHRVWHGSYQRRGAEKIASLDDGLLLRAFPSNHWQAIGKDLEAAIDPDAKLLRVRRQRKTGEVTEQQRAAETRQVAVIGDEEARARGAAPAFHRTRATREITFKCAWCAKSVTQQRYPSPKPRYCSETCEQEAQREKTRARVQRLREKRRDAGRDIR